MGSAYVESKKQNKQTQQNANSQRTNCQLPKKRHSDGWAKQVKMVERYKPPVKK